MCGAWLLAVVSGAVLSGAGGDASLIEAIKAGNRAAVRTPCCQHPARTQHSRDRRKRPRFIGAARG